MRRSLEIDAAFDGGNIEVLAVSETDAELRIRKDSNGPWFQWFFFSVRAEVGRAITLRVINAAESAYPQGWEGYRACVSDDGATWRRTTTDFRDGALEIRHIPAATLSWFAYFTPYSLPRHRRHIEAIVTFPGVDHDVLGRSCEGRDLDRLKLGQGALSVWFLGRQHPGESMASWWMEGAVERLLDDADPVVAALRNSAQFHIVPIVNVDGVASGNLRGNANGLDLNRQWHSPDEVNAPEVAAILAAMDRSGVDFVLDVHGDETIPHVFIDACDADPQATPDQIEGVARFRAALLSRNAAFQTEIGYPKTYAGEEAPGMCSRAVPRRFGGLGVTLEMPFKDSLEAPDPVVGWSPAACRRLGRDCIDAIAAALKIDTRKGVP